MAPGSPASGHTMSPDSVMTSAGAKPKPGDAQFLAGDQIGPRYTVIKLLGAGGMGAVYHAFDQELGVGVAVKLIRPSLQADATAARDLEQRFKRELLLARQITHKHVVRIHDIGDIEGIKYLTMPFIDGETLADLLRREGKLPVPRAASIVSQVAAGLEAAHAKGVVHRDLKPENIMIEKDTGDALIMDFGIARSVESGSTQTAAGSVIGTLEYMPPEQAQGRKVDGRADIYSLGLILYDCLVGRHRVAKAENPMKEMMSRLAAPPAPPRSLNVDVPEALDRIVRKCLEPAAENRYQTTHELVAALGALTADDYSHSEASPKPPNPGDPPSRFDPDATYLGGPAKASPSDLDVTSFAGVPGPAGRRDGDDAATIGPTPAASGGTPKGLIEVGHQFGTRYHIIRELGVGGMGAVYQAWDSELGVAVAVKVIRPEIASNPEASADIERRFKRELLLARQITHPNVVRIHDLGDIDGIKYITMPFIEGSDLSTILDEHKQLPVPRALHIARGVVAGLVSAHEAGVVHRDLKPANIMIGADDVPTIMDFGIARSADGPQQPSVTPRGVRPNDLSRTAGLSASTTQAGAVVGTVAYMAPEQASGKPVDQRADIYAFGLIFYDMLVGGRRREGAQSAIAELMERMQTAPPAPRTLDPTIPEAVDAIIRRCLEPDPEKRFKTTVDLNAALERLDDSGKPLPMIRRLTWRGVGLSAAAVLLLLAGTYFVGQQSALPVEEREPLAVLIANLDNRTGDAVFDGALEQMFQLGVEGTSFITAYPRQSAQRLATEIAPGSTLDEERARLVAIREGVKVVLAGRIEPDGAGYRISMRAIDPTRGEPLASIEERAASKSDVPKTVGEVVAEVRATLGDTATRDTMLASAETFTATSLEAVRAYSLAQDLAVGGKHEEAVVKYQEAIDRDADFGRAYSGLALSLSFLGRPNEAESQWKNALSRLERMTEREKYRTLGLYYNSVTRNYEKAIESFSTLVTLYPADAAGHSNLALAYFRNLNFQKALEEGGLAVKIYPGSVATWNNYVLYAMYAGDFATASAEGARIIKEHPDFHKAYLPSAMAAMADGNFSGARDAYAGMATAGPRGASLASVGLADQAMYEGRFADAQAILQKGIAEDQQNKNGAAMAAKYLALGEAFEAQGQVKLAVDAAERALKLVSGEAVSVAAARLFLRNGKEAAAEAIAANLGQQLQPQSRAYAKIIEGELALRRRRMVDTIEALLAAQKLADLWIGRFNLGLAYVEAGHYAEAVTELELCVKRRGEATAIFLDDVPTFRYMTPLGYWLGRAKEELGMKAAATEHYKAFLALRPNSPKDPLVVDARRRLGPS
jgi:serine/threonine protein kinase/tetratricopeptide (TPR) repeat protein